MQAFSQRHNFEEIDYKTWRETWQRIVDTNLTAASNLCFCAGQKMLAHGGGRIVNVSSRGAFRGEPLMPWYGASKAGMNAMGQSLAQALGPKGVFVYTVAPGFVETEMAAAILASEEGANIRNQSSIGRVAQPEEIAKTIVVPVFRGTTVYDWMHNRRKRCILPAFLIINRRQQVRGSSPFCVRC